MIEYRYEELTSEEKRLIHDVQDNPLLTDTTFFFERERYGVNRMTHRALNKVLRYTYIFGFLFFSFIFLGAKHNLVLYPLYFGYIAAAYLMVSSLKKISKLRFEEGSSKFQKEVHLLNVDVLGRVLFRNRKPIEARILKDTPRYLKVYMKERAGISQQKFSFFRRKKFRIKKRYILKIIPMNGYYYMFIRWNLGKILHIRFEEQEFKKLDSEYRERNTEEIGMSEVSEERYYQLVEESKEEAVELKSYTKSAYILYYSMLYFTFFTFIIAGTLF